MHFQHLPLLYGVLYHTRYSTEWQLNQIMVPLKRNILGEEGKLGSFVMQESGKQIDNLIVCIEFFDTKYKLLRKIGQNSVTFSHCFFLSSFCNPPPFPSEYEYTKQKDQLIYI